MEIYNSWQKAENNFPYWSNQGTEFNTSDDKVLRRENNQYQNISVGSTLKLLAKHSWELFTGGRQYTKHLAWQVGSKSYTRVWEGNGHLQYGYEGEGFFRSALLYTSRWMYQMGGDKRVDPNQTVGFRSYELERTWQRTGWKQVLEQTFQMVGVHIRVSL